MSELEKRLRELHQQESNLKSLIMAERHLPTKEALIQQKAKILQQIQKLEAQKAEETEKQSEKELEKLLKENLMFIFVSANGRRLNISTDLTIQIIFEPCQHRKTIPIKELLRNPYYPSNRNLLQTWQRLLNQDLTITMMLNCKQCQEESESLKATLGLWQRDKPSGRANIVLRRLQ